MVEPRHARLIAFGAYALLAFLFFGLGPLIEPGRQYIGVLDDPQILGALRNSLLVAFATTVVCTVVGAAAALGLRRLRHTAAAEGLLLLPMVAPEVVLDYVVWHEVCHLEVMDHSPRFWDLLASRWPGYREQVRWLRRHGATLVL